MSCHNCKNRIICSFYNDINNIVSQGLKTHTLTTSENKTDSTSSSWMQIFKSLASACTRYQSNDIDYNHFYTKEILNYQKGIVQKYKKNKDLMKQFIDAYSEENRRTIIKEQLESDYDDHYDFLISILKKENDVNDFMETFDNHILNIFGL